MSRFSRTGEGGVYLRDFRINDRFTTADAGLEITGSDLTELLLAGAEGMMAIIFGEVPTGNAAGEMNIVLQSPEIEQLLIDWLSELLYHFDTDGYVPVIYNVQVEKNDNYRLRARVGYRLFEGASDQAEHEIKAVTYYKLKVEREDGNYHCHLVFDL